MIIFLFAEGTTLDEPHYNRAMDFKLSPYYHTANRRQSKTILTIDERGSKSLETLFSIAICRHLGDKWQSKTLFLAILYLRSSIVLTFSIVAYPV